MSEPLEPFYGQNMQQLRRETKCSYHGLGYYKANYRFIFLHRIEPDDVLDLYLIGIDFERFPVPLIKEWCGFRS
jgi:hypothetical protein